MSQPPPSPADDAPHSSDSTPPALAEFEKTLEAWNDCNTLENAEQLEAVSMKLMQLAVQHMAENPALDEKWWAEINAYEEEFQWEKSVARRREHLAWAREQSPQTLWKHVMDLSRLLWMCGQTSEAVTMADEAVLLANQSGLVLAQSMTASLAAWCHAALGRMDHAQGLVEKTLGAVATELKDAPLIRRATIPLRLCQARLAQERGDMLLAQRLLEEVWPEIETYADSRLLAGLRASHAEYADIAGRIHLARGESTLAVESFQRALEHREAILGMVHAADHFTIYAVAKTWLRLANALESTEPERAATLRQQARERFEFLRVPPVL